jgi:hypothetical protein
MPTIETSTFTPPLPICFRITLPTANRDFFSKHRTEKCSLPRALFETVSRESLSEWAMSARYGRQLVEDVKYLKESAENWDLASSFRRYWGRSWVLIALRGLPIRRSKLAVQTGK